MFWDPGSDWGEARTKALSCRAILVANPTHPTAKITRPSRRRKDEESRGDTPVDGVRAGGERTDAELLRLPQENKVVHHGMAGRIRPLSSHPTATGRLWMGPRMAPSPSNHGSRLRCMSTLEPFPPLSSALGVWPYSLLDACPLNFWELSDKQTEATFSSLECSDLNDAWRGDNSWGL